MPNKGRVEYKYFLPENIKSAFFQDLKLFMRPDRHAKAKDSSYQVSSIYFDNMQLKSYHEKVEGQPHRAKLRVRFYPDSGNVELFNIELKIKRYDRIIKKKNVLSRKDLCLLTGSLNDTTFLEANDPVSRYILKLVSFDRFLPFLRIDYKRHAFFSLNDDKIRVTIDSDIFCGRFYPGINAGPTLPVLPRGVEILEIKTPDYFPFWLTFLMKKYSLNLSAISKYALSVQNMAANNTFYFK